MLFLGAHYNYKSKARIFFFKSHNRIKMCFCKYPDAHSLPIKQSFPAGFESDNFRILRSKTFVRGTPGACQVLANLDQRKEQRNA